MLPCSDHKRGTAQNMEERTSKRSRSLIYQHNRRGQSGKRLRLHIQQRRQSCNSIPRDREILFLPDLFLGAYVKEKTGRDMEIWPGECHVHAGITPDIVNQKLAENAGAEFLVHPECGRVTQFMYFAEKGDFNSQLTHVFSTEGMVRHARESASSKFLVATETGILHRMRKQNPDKTFLTVKDDAVCQYMKSITLEKVATSLRNMVHEVHVPEDVADRSRRAIGRMLELA